MRDGVCVSAVLTRALRAAQEIANDPMMRNCAILVLANKQDMVRACMRLLTATLTRTRALAMLTPPLPAQPEAIKPRDLCPLLGLDQMKERKWHVQGTVATRGDGLYEGLDWLSSTLTRMRRLGQNTSVGNSKVVARVK
jgi:ADP-ribosylation factor protein 1